MIYPLVTDLAAEGIPVAVTCRVLEFSKQGYYQWRANPVTERDWADEQLVNVAVAIHSDDPAFGYPFIADELPEKGFTAVENKVQRLCRDHGIWSVFSKKRGLNRKPGAPVHDDLLERDFTAAEGKLYICAVNDGYFGRIVGYTMDSRMNPHWPSPRRRTLCGHAARQEQGCTRTTARSFDLAVSLNRSGTTA